MKEKRHCPECGTRLGLSKLDDQDNPNSLLVRCKNGHGWRWSYVRAAGERLFHETLTALEPERPATAKEG